MTDSVRLPTHVGIIMDGNGRWATRQGLPRTEGHKAGAQAFRRICEYAADIGVPYLTFYAFSTENWRRPPEEVNAIMSLFRDFLIEADERLAENEEKGMRICFMGSYEGLSPELVSLFNSVQRHSSNKTKTVINLAVNYGGRAELLSSVRSLAARAATGEISPDAIDEDDIAAGLYTAGQPDPDLIIRPSGERRLSNFMIWQAAYAEMWYTDVLWPDFTVDDFDRAMRDFAQRNRRFGGIETKTD